MSGAAEATPAVLGVGANRTRRSNDVRKPLRKKAEDQTAGVEANNGNVGAKSCPRTGSVRVPSMLRRHESLQGSNLSLSASCSSDASKDSFHSRASTGRMCSKSGWKKLLGSKARNGTVRVPQGVEDRRRCAWVSSASDPAYVAFHDEEWGVPAHDDKKLFELLVLSGALAELTWPVILSKRLVFREAFADFDPMAVSKMSEKKITAPGSPASSLLSELKLRSIVENARQVCKVIDEFGSFDEYIWSFVNYKPIIGSFRYPRQVPVKAPKADVISKDLIKRGFRSVGPTVVYSFMQVAGLRNDHLTSCFRFNDCGADDVEEGSGNSGICRSMDELSLPAE